jgi:predicted Zn finger-like uncharacterized protein
MNVTCPQCASVFRVDPAKIPEQGIRAQCSACPGIISISAPAENVAVAAAPVVERPAPPPPPPPAAPAPEPPTQLSSTLFGARSPTPVAPPAPPVPPAAVPFDALPEPSAPAEPSPPASSPQAPRGGFNNPFLQQDPTTRARRLARALVSDLVVYHPEKRQQGLQDGNLKELFAEEIRKSWEEYTEQVGEGVAKSTPYFTDALNEILAEGESLFG